MYKPLIAITTFNKLSMTIDCLTNFLGKHFDLIIIDDCSNDDTIEFLEKNNYSLIQKKERKGLTDSWNLVYNYFKDHKIYTHMIIMNNDVMVPDGCIENMLSDHPLVVPMTTYDGAGYIAKDQAIDYHIDISTPLILSNLQNIQDRLKREFKRINSWTGFMMCFSREIIKYELPDGKLFDPKNINTGNDDDLAKRCIAHLALGSFVYHYKGFSFNKTISNRNNLNKEYD